MCIVAGGEKQVVLLLTLKVTLVTNANISGANLPISVPCAMLGISRTVALSGNHL